MNQTPASQHSQLRVIGDGATASASAPPAPAYKHSETYVRLVASFAGVVGLAYLVWRVGWTLNQNALWLALPLLLAEVHGYVTYLGYTFMTWDCSPPRRRDPLAHATVDFYIPTYNEPFSVLAPTIAGAMAVEYPHTVYVLDDSRRRWVRQLCRRLGAEYVTRPDNRHAKAGNLNHALSITTGEFVAVIDADFVPCKTFISDMLGYFTDPKVAFVQGPQEFYNRDSFQHLPGDAEAWHEQATFFRAIQVGKNRWNSAFWCGCPSLLRRAALESVGGVQSDTVTEDLHTSLKLHSLGWKSIYHPGIVALGIAPNDYHGFILQRLRWAAGTMQVIRREWRIRGLTMAQRISYLSSIGTYFDALRKATFLAIVPLVILTDQLPLATSLLVFLTFWTFQFLLNGYANNLLARGNNRYLMTEFFDLMKMFAFIHATVTLITGRQVRFQVTPKGGSADRRLQGLLAPYVALILVYALSVVVGLARVTGLLPTYILAAQVAAMLWAFGILCVLIAVVVYGYRKVSQRSADRVRVNLEARYREAYQRIEQPATIENLTTSGCAIRTAEAPSIARSMAVRILEPPLAFRARVRTVRAQPDGFVSGLSIQASPSTAVELALILADSILSQAPGRGGEVGEPPEVESIAA